MIDRQNGETAYCVTSYEVISQPDNYINGAGDICYDGCSGYYLMGKTLCELLSKLSDDFGVEVKEILLDSCGEIGRLDIQVLQQTYYTIGPAPRHYMERWKLGEIDLYLTTYTFHVEKKITGFSLEDTIKSETQNQ